MSNNVINDGGCYGASKPLIVMSKGPSAYIDYKTLTASITSELKFNPINFDIVPVQVNYLNPILRYINESLVLCDSTDIYEKIFALMDAAEVMDDLILKGDIKQICFLLNYSERIFELIPYTMLWTNIMTYIKLSLDYNYGWRNKQRSGETSIQCMCNCSLCSNSKCPYCYCNGTESSELENMFSYRPIQDPYYSEDQGYSEHW